MTSIKIFGQDKYRDVSLFLILIPLINAINYYLTYATIRFNAHGLLTFIIDTLMGYAAWITVRSIIIYLDRIFPFTDRPLKRIVIQLISTTVAGLLVIILLTEMINYFATSGPVPKSFYLFDIFIFIIWFFVVNGIYIGLHYYHEWTNSEAQRSKDKEIRKEGFLVNQGKQSISIPFNDIFCLFVEGEYVILLTNQSKKYFLSQSLDKAEQLCPDEWFFRLNRQFICHRNAITGFSRLENGKLEIFIRSLVNLPTAIQVSRTKAAAFKTWYG